MITDPDSPGFPIAIRNCPSPWESSKESLRYSILEFSLISSTRTPIVVVSTGVVDSTRVGAVVVVVVVLKSGAAELSGFLAAIVVVVAVVVVLVVAVVVVVLISLDTVVVSLAVRLFLG